MFELFPRMASLGLTLIIFYYSFAIVGMEFFADAVFPNCCKWDLLSASMQTTIIHLLADLVDVCSISFVLSQHQHCGRVLQTVQQNCWEQNCVGRRLLLPQQLQPHSQQLWWGFIFFKKQHFVIFRYRRSTSSFFISAGVTLSNTSSAVTLFELTVVNNWYITMVRSKHLRSVDCTQFWR